MSQSNEFLIQSNASRFGLDLNKFFYIRWSMDWTGLNERLVLCLIIFFSSSSCCQTKGELDGSSANSPVVSPITQSHPRTNTVTVQKGLLVYSAQMKAQTKYRQNTSLTRDCPTNGLPLPPPSAGRNGVPTQIRNPVVCVLPRKKS